MSKKIKLDELQILQFEKIELKLNNLRLTKEQIKLNEELLKVEQQKLISNIVIDHKIEIKDTSVRINTQEGIIYFE